MAINGLFFDLMVCYPTSSPSKKRRGKLQRIIAFCPFCVLVILLFYTFHVATCCGINFDQIALIAEQGYPNFSAGFNGSSFQGVGGSVTAHTRFRVRDLQYHRLREFNRQDGVFLSMVQNIDNITLFEKFAIVNHFFRDGNLVESFLVHQGVTAIFRVEVLKFSAFHPNFGDGVTTVKGVFNDPSGGAAF